MSLQTCVIRIEGGLEKDLSELGADIVAIYKEEEPIVAGAVSQIFSAFLSKEWPTLVNALIAIFTALLSGGLSAAEVAAVAAAPGVLAQTEANAKASAEPVLATAIPEAEASLKNAEPVAQ